MHYFFLKATKTEDFCRDAAVKAFEERLHQINGIYSFAGEVQ